MLQLLHLDLPGFHELFGAFQLGLLALGAGFPKDELLVSALPRLDQVGVVSGLHVALSLFEVLNFCRARTDVCPELCDLVP